MGINTSGAWTLTQQHLPALGGAQPCHVAAMPVATVTDPKVTAQQRGAALRKLRVANHLTQAELGELLCLGGLTGASKARSVSRYETKGCPAWTLRLAELAIDVRGPDLRRAALVLKLRLLRRQYRDSVSIGQETARDFDNLEAELATIKARVKECVSLMCESATDTVWAGGSTMADALAWAIGEDTLGPDGWPLPHPRLTAERIKQIMDYAQRGKADLHRYLSGGITTGELSPGPDYPAAEDGDQ